MDVCRKNYIPTQTRPPDLAFTESATFKSVLAKIEGDSIPISLHVLRSRHTITSKQSAYSTAKLIKWHNFSSLHMFK